MLNVMSTQNLQDFMAAVFRNFREAEDRLNEVAAPATVLDENGDPSIPSGGGSSPSNMFDVIYLSNTSTKLYKDSSGSIVFEDAVSGAVSLATILAGIASLLVSVTALLVDVAALQSYFWSEDGKIGIKLQRNSKWVWLQVNSTLNGLSIYRVTDV